MSINRAFDAVIAFNFDDTYHYRIWTWMSLSFLDLKIKQWNLRFTVPIINVEQWSVLSNDIHKNCISSGNI